MNHPLFTAPSTSRSSKPAFLALLAFVFVLPFAHSVALRSVLLLLCSIGALLVIKRDGWRQGFVPGLLLLWAAWGLVSLTWSVRRDYSAYQLLHELLPGVLAFYCAYALVRSPARWRCFVTTIVLSASLYAICGVAAALAPASAAAYLLTDTGYGSTTLVLALPFFVIALRRPHVSALERSALSIALLLLLAAAYYSANRVFWVAAAALLLLSLFFTRSASDRAFSPGRLLLALLAMALLGYLLVSISMLRGIVPNGAYDIGKVLAEDVRWGIWQQALDLVARAPWLGYGYGRTILDDVLYIRQGLLVAHAHNVWLNQAISLGLPGLALFIVFTTGFALAFWRGARRQSGLLREAGLAGLLVCVVFFAKNLTDDFFIRHSGQLFLALCGAALGILRAQRHETGEWN